MRTRLVNAALAAFTLSVGLLACRDISQTTGVDVEVNLPREGTVLKTDSVKNESCTLIYSLEVAPPQTNLFNMVIAEARRIFVRTDSLGRNCPPRYTWEWASSNANIARVNAVSSTDALVTAVNTGSTTICVKAKENQAFVLCVDASVGSVSSPTVTIPQGNITLSNCTGFVPTYTRTVTVDGVAVTNATWTSSNTAVATVVNGTVTVTGTAGTSTITAQTSSGNAVITVTVNQCTQSSCSITAFNPTVTGGVSLVVGDTRQITPNVTSSPAGCATVSYSATGGVTVSNTGLVTATAAPTGYVTVTATAGTNTTAVTLTFNVSVPPTPVVVITPGTDITTDNCAATSRTVTLGVTVNGTATTGTWSSSNATVATVNQTTGVVTLTGTAGTATITVQTSSGSATRLITVGQCPVQGVTVDVQPPTFSLVVGQTPLAVTANVTAPAGQSTAVTWTAVFNDTTTQSALSCVSLSPQSNNVVLVSAIAGCTRAIRVVATSVADVNVSDFSLGNTSSGNVSCSITVNGNATATDTVVVAKNGNVTAIASCTNQYGATFRPWGYTDVPTVLTVNGSSGVESVGTANYAVGPIFTLAGINVGTATFTVQAALRDKTVIATRPVKVQ